MTDPKNLWNHFSAALLLTLLALGGTARLWLTIGPNIAGQTEMMYRRRKAWRTSGRKAGRSCSGPIATRAWDIRGRRSSVHAITRWATEREKEYLIALDIPAEAGEAKEAWAVELGEKFDFRGNNWSTAKPHADGRRQADLRPQRQRRFGLRASRGWQVGVEEVVSR